MRMSLVWCSELRSSQKRLTGGKWMKKGVDEEKDTEWSRNIAGWCGERWSREISTRFAFSSWWQRAGLNAKQVSDVLVLLMQKGLDVADPDPKCDKANKSHHDRFGIYAAFKLTTCGEHTSTILHQNDFGPALFRSLPCFACSQCGRLPSPGHLHQEIWNNQTTSHVQTVSYHTLVLWPVWRGLPLPACTLDSTKND